MARQKQHDFCTIDGCDRPHKARGYCALHYHTWWRNNAATAEPAGQDPNFAFVDQLTATLAAAPDYLLTKHDRDLITGVALTAAMALRGIIPITPAMRAEILHKAVDRATTGVEL